MTFRTLSTRVTGGPLMTGFTIVVSSMIKGIYTPIGSDMAFGTLSGPVAFFFMTIGTVVVIIVLIGDIHPTGGGVAAGT